MGNFKYALYTDKICVSIFREKAPDYRRVLRLDSRARQHPGMGWKTSVLRE